MSYSYGKDNFWTVDHKYEDRVREYYQNIEIVSPSVATGGKNKCWWCVNGCSFCATNVTYIEHRP